ncbi:MAG: YkgJ family cysteine cluster protein [Dissulfuribacterales bacterium]
MAKSACKRCGACCIKGGPVLHKADISLLSSSLLTPNVLVTIRKGEPVYHPTEDRLVELPLDIIKIKSKPAENTCMFFDAQAMCCSIYDERPLECRAFRCWDTEEAEGLFLTDVLARENIFPVGSAFLEVINAYDQRFPPKEIFSMIFEARDLLDSAQEILSELQDVAEKDAMFRRRVRATFKIEEDALDFFLGRSVALLQREYSAHHKG